MQDVISKLDSEDVIALCGMVVGVVAILGGITVAVAKVVSSHYRRTQLDEMEATLKMEMIQRGMSADEISQVLAARMDSATRSFGFARGGMPGRPVSAFGHQEG